MTKTLATRVIAGRPCHRRVLWAVTVPKCPRCGNLHQHRVANAARLFAGEIERRCPVAGTRYVLEVAA
jgi:hypothetical protein